MKKHKGIVTKAADYIKLSESCTVKLHQFLIEDSSPSCSEGNLMNHCIRQFIQAKSFSDQICHVKKLVSLVHCGELNNMQVHAVFNVLLTLYFDHDIQKHSLHKLLVSCLNSLEDAHTTNSCHNIIKEAILKHLQGISNEKEFVFSMKCLLESSPSSVRHECVVENICMLTDNYIHWLIICLHQIDPSRCSKDVEVYSGNVSLTHTACQVFFRLLSITTDSLDCQLIDKYERVQLILYETLLEGCGNMDLLISIGLCICQLIINRLADDELVLERVKVLMGVDDVSYQSDKHCFAQCCLLNGIVNSFKHLPIKLHHWILHICNKLFNRKMREPALLVFMKMLVSWTTILRVKLHSEFVEQLVYEPLLNYLLLVWEHSTQTVRQCSREIFSNIVQIIKANERLRLEALQLLASYPWSCKGKYGFLLEYMTISGVDETLSYVSNKQTISILDEVMPYIAHQHLTSYVSELLHAIMVCDRRSHRYSKAEWTDKWLMPLVNTLNRYPHLHRHVSENLLPRITKIWPETIVELLKRMSTTHSYSQPGKSCDQRDESCDQLDESCDRLDESCDWPVDIYLMLARIARKCGLLMEDAVDGEALYGVLDARIIDCSLHCPISQRSLSAFALLCESHKTSSPIQQREFQWVLEFMRDNSYHMEGSFKQQMLSHFKQFLFHVLESSRKLDCHHLGPYQSFLGDVGLQQVERLDENSLSNNRAVPLESLTLLSDIFPYS